MRAALKILEPQGRAIAGAKIRAWWDGASFDEAAFLAAQEAANAAPQEPANLDSELFEAPRDPRLDALARLWGEGRIAPASDEAHLIALSGAPETGAIVLLGPGHIGPVAAFSGFASVAAYEWRVETRETLARAIEERKLAHVTLAPLDLDLTTLAPETADGVFSLDEFTYASNPNRVALQIARALKPGAKAVIETYAGAPGAGYAAAFATAFAEPQIHTPAALAHALTEAGLDIEAEEDISAALVSDVRTAFARFAEAASAEGAAAPSADEAREIGWEIQTWRARMKMLSHGALQRRRILVHRRP